MTVSRTARQRRKWAAGEGLAYKLAQAFRAQIEARTEENDAREARNVRRRRLNADIALENRRIDADNKTLAVMIEAAIKAGADPMTLPTPAALLPLHVPEDKLPLVTREETNAWLRADSRARREESERRQTEADREAARKREAHIAETRRARTAQAR